MLLAANFEKYRVMSVNKLLLLVSLFIVLIDNNALWTTLWSALGTNPASHLVFVLSFLVFFLTLTLLLLSLFGFARIIKPAVMVALILSSVIAYFIDNMHVIFSVSMMQNVFETDVKEAGELINAGMFLHIALFGLLPALLVWFIKIDSESVAKELLSRAKMLSVMLLAATLTVFWAYKDYSLVLRENRDIRYLVNPVFPVVSLVKYLKLKGKDNNRVITPVFQDAAKFSNVGANNRKDLLVIVVGETARAENFSLNGYGRDTNPLLRKENIINFTNVSSCGTATAESVPCMFSDLTKDNFSTDKAKQRENMLDGFKNAGFDVLWRDNNSSCKGVCTRVATEDLLNMKVKDLCNDEECYDEILLHRLDEYVNNLKHDAVIVLHQKGSHGPAYYKRYPEQFAKFTPECNVS
ncbi:MAG TPA: phosphoethanolamine transferase domain-containing protein, partial [Gammaproteobacteria bacterium]